MNWRDVAQRGVALTVRKKHGIYQRQSLVNNFLPEHSLSMKAVRNLRHSFPWCLCILSCGLYEKLARSIGHTFSVPNSAYIFFAVRGVQDSSDVYSESFRQRAFSERPTRLDPPPPAAAYLDVLGRILILRRRHLPTYNPHTKHTRTRVAVIRTRVRLHFTQIRLYHRDICLLYRRFRPV